MTVSFTGWMNRRVGKLDWIDMGCVKAGAMLFALLAAKIWPEVLSLPLWAYAAAFALVSIRPLARICSNSPGREEK